MKEYIDNYIIDIEDKNFKITSDAIFLVDFMLEDGILNKKLLEIGSGTGYISIKLLKYIDDISSVEIQEDLYKIFKKNIETNNMNINLINDDVKNIKDKFDIIVSNPPYYKINSGKLPHSRIMQISKFEIALNLQELIDITYYLLNDEGLCYFVYPLSRMDEMIHLLEMKKFKIEKLKKSNKIFAIKAKKN